MTRAIYVVRSDPGPVKVGIANNPNARLRQLRVSSPVPLHLAYAGKTEANIDALEKEAHRILVSHRLSGEWFSASPEQAVSAVLRAADVLGIKLSQLPVTTKKRGRPAGKEYPVSVQVRLSKSQAAELDRVRGDQTRSEFIRELVARGYLKPKDPKA